MGSWQGELLGFLQLYGLDVLGVHLSWAICAVVGGLLLGGLMVWLMTRRREAA